MTSISQGSVATSLRCGGNFNHDLVYHSCRFSLQKIGQHLAELQVTVWSDFFALPATLYVRRRCFEQNYESQLQSVSVSNML